MPGIISTAMRTKPKPLPMMNPEEPKAPPAAAAAPSAPGAAGLRDSLSAMNERAGGRGAWSRADAGGAGAASMPGALDPATVQGRRDGLAAEQSRTGLPAGPSDGRADALRAQLSSTAAKPTAAPSAMGTEAPAAQPTEKTSPVPGAPAPSLVVEPKPKPPNGDTSPGANRNDAVMPPGGIINGAMNDRDYARSLYQSILGRDATDEEISNAQRAMTEGGMSRQQLEEFFYNSDEARARPAPGNDALVPPGPGGDGGGDTGTAGGPDGGAPGDRTGVDAGGPGSKPPAGQGGPVDGTQQPGPQGGVPTDKPVTREVTTEETVRGQLQTLLDEDSPLMARARARAQERAAASGLRNSTMAAQAGEAAMIDAAMPIATADAGTYSRQALVNQDAVNNYINTGRQLEAQLTIAQMDDARVRELARSEDARMRELAAAEIRSRETLTREELENRANIAREEMRSRENIALVDAGARSNDAAARLRLGEMELEAANRRFDTEMGFRRDESTRQQSNFDAEMGYRRDTSTIDANFRQNQLDQQTRDNYATRISDIMSNPNLSAEERDAAVRNINTIYGRTGGTPPGSGSNLFGRPAGSGAPAGSGGQQGGDG